MDLEVGSRCQWDELQGTLTDPLEISIHLFILSIDVSALSEEKCLDLAPTLRNFVLTGRDTQKQADMSTTKLAIILPNLLLLPSSPCQSTFTPIQSVSHTAARGTLLKHTSHHILNSKPPKSSHLHKMQTSPPGLLGPIISGPFMPLCTIPYGPITLSFPATLVPLLVLKSSSSFCLMGL